jgi:CHC2 zinc finger
MDRQHAQRVLDFQALRGVPISAVLERYNLLSGLKRIGKQLFGVCPLHGSGKNRKQFVVDPEKNLWVCHGDCNRGGGVLELVAEMERVDVTHAARLAASWFAIPSGNPDNQQAKRRRKAMAGEKPSHKVFTVIGEGDDAFWCRLGSAWPNRDGRGLSIILDGLPVNGRLVLRAYTEQDAQEDEKKTAKRKK